MNKRNFCTLKLSILGPRLTSGVHQWEARKLSSSEAISMGLEVLTQPSRPWWDRTVTCMCPASLNGPRMICWLLLRSYIHSSTRITDAQGEASEEVEDGWQNLLILCGINTGQLEGYFDNCIVILGDRRRWFVKQELIVSIPLVPCSQIPGHPSLSPSCLTPGEELHSTHLLPQRNL